MTWSDAYCLTLVGDATPSQVLEALGAVAVTNVRGVDGLDRRIQQYFGDGYDPDHLMVGAADIGGRWVLIAEVNGFVGVTERLMGPLAGGRTIVSHFCNVNGVRRMHWWRDGRLLVDVDLLFPTDRFGAEPDVVHDGLVAVGVPLDGGDAILDVDLDAAGTALMQWITGVACTSQMFVEAELLSGVVPMPSHDEQFRYGEALRATWSAPRSW